MGERRPWKLAGVWLAVSVSVFLTTYEFTNWWTSQRHNVPSIVFGWEHRIPFLAWTIVPYWTTNVFYALSMFLCKTRDELNAHARRLLAAQIISVAVFLIFPLRFSFEQPKTDGLFGWLFHALAFFDKPFNQAPSLHVSLTAILWANYSRNLRGTALWLTRACFVLAVLSTLTTYQHHFIDLPTGLAVGLFCIALFPMEPTRAVEPPDQKISAGYLASD